MPTYNDKRKASLAEFSVMHYQRFLAALSHNGGRGCCFPDRLLCLNYYFRHITLRQYRLLFPWKDRASLNVTLNRMVRSGVLEKDQDIPEFRSYAITKAGAAHITGRLPSLFHAYYPLPDDGEYHFTLDMVLGYLNARLKMRAPSYWYHFFGIRDFYFTFLSSQFTCPDFLFLQECWGEGGRPLSVYEQALNAGTKLGGREMLRPDGLLMSRCPAYRDLDIPLSLEFDSGSQKSSVLAGKVWNYVKSSLSFFREYEKNEGLKVHMPPSVVFSVASKYACRKRPEPVRRLGRRKYRGCLLRAAEIYDVVSALDCPPGIVCSSGATLSSCIALFESIEGRILGTPAQELLQELLRYRKECPQDASKSLHSILQGLDREKDGLSHDYESSMRLYYSGYYRRRRDLLWQSVAALPQDGLASALLAGLSIFTVSHELLPDCLPYLAPELYWYSSSLKTFLSDFGCYGGRLTLSYGHTGRTADGHLFRNHYAATDADGTYHFFFENISDDLGGNRRVMHFLSCPFSIEEGTKIVCIASDDFLSERWPEIVRSPFCMGSPAPLKTSWDKNAGELLFCTPADFEAGRFFFLLPDGRRCYKTR